MAKKIFTLALTEEHDQRLDELAAQLVDVINRPLTGAPNRSGVVQALIETCDPDALRRALKRRRRVAA